MSAISIPKGDIELAGLLYKPSDYSSKALLSSSSILEEV
jgi:hypothetical protein